MAAIGLLWFFPSIAMAQYSQNPDADYMQINVKGWLFCPVTDATEVRGFLAYLHDAEATGSNVELVWYQREADESWTTWGWAYKDLGAAVWYVRAILGDETAFTRDTELNEAANIAGPESAAAPKAMSGGLFFDDPLQPAVQQSSDPITTVSLLQAVGWRVAPSMSRMQVGESMDCNGEPIGPVPYLMRDLTDRVEDAYFALSTVENPCAAWPCTCTITYGTSTPTPPGTWTVTSVTTDSGKRCSYSRPALRPWTKTGDTWLLCTTARTPGLKSEPSAGSSRSRRPPLARLRDYIQLRSGRLRLDSLTYECKETEWILRRGTCAFISPCWSSVRASRLCWFAAGRTGRPSCCWPRRASRPRCSPSWCGSGRCSERSCRSDLNHPGYGTAFSSIDLTTRRRS